MTSFQIYCESCDTDSTIQIQDKKKHADFCPVCGTELEDAPGGGVKCPNKDCGYWFCY